MKLRTINAFVATALLLSVMILIGCTSNMYVQSAKISINNLQDFPRAKEQLLTGTTVTPDDPEVWYWLGYVYFELEDFDSMLISFERSLSMSPRRQSEVTSYKNEAWRLVFNRAVSPFNQNDWETAAAMFELTSRIKPDNYESLKFTAICYMQMRNYERAQALFQQALTMTQSQTDLDLNFSLLNLYWAIEDWGQVVAQANTVLAMPDSILDMEHSTDAIAKKAISYFNMEDFENAIAAWESAIANDSSFADYFFNVALLYEQMDRVEDAERAYMKAIELAPQDDQSRRRVANLYLRQQRWEELAGVMVPWLFPDGQIAVYEPLVREREVWNVLRVAFLNMERIQDAEVVNQIMDNL